MRRLLTALMAVGAIVMAGVCGPAMAGERGIVLKEHVNRRWTNELLSYPFEAPEGACHEDSVSLEDPEGPTRVPTPRFWRPVPLLRFASDNGG